MAGLRRSILALGLLTASLIPSYSVSGSETVTYAYDANGQLVKVSHSGTVNNGLSACYAYDRADNRNNVTVSTTSSCSPPSPSVSFSVSDVAVKEGSNLVFTVTKTGTASGTITLDYGTVDAGAYAGPDYTAKSGSLSFLAGDTSKTVSVTTIDDTIIESSEPLLLNIFNASVGAGISDGQAVGTIQDNETDCAGVTYSVASNAAMEEGVNSVFTVTKSGATSSSCSVNYATADGNTFPQAFAPGDYTATSGMLTFAAAQTSQSVSVPTTEDATYESNETFRLSLSNPNRGATLGSPSTATATINDDDACAGVSFTIASNGAVTEGGSSIFTVTRTGGSNVCQVSYSTSNGSALAPGDYTAASGTLTFAYNQNSQTVLVTTIDDAATESAETFNMALSNPSPGSTLGMPSSAAATINDNDSGGVCSGVSYSVNDPATVTEGFPITFTVTKTGTTSSSCTLSYSTSNGTAVAPTQYTATSGTLTFTAAQSSKTVTVTTIDTFRTAGTRTMFLNLGSASGGASISDSQGTGSILHSEEPWGGGGGGCPTC
jgi:hypothetical protein